MSAEYGFDLYPRDDPRDGTRLVRFTYEDMIAAEYRDVIGVGAGQATVWVDHAGVEHVDVRGEQYIRVVRLGGVEAVVGGIWTSKLPFETAVASERRHLTLSGPGQMAYLARSRMAPHTYVHDVFEGQDPYDGMFRLSEQSTIFAGGPYLGAMLWRVIYEAQHFRVGTTPYTHRHADGETYTDIHDDDRTVSRIPDLVMGFDQFEDSNGNAWTLTAGEFHAQVGENVLGVVQRLMQAGLSIWMDPDTFTLYAWEGRPATKLGRSTDRTGSSWGANVVRFQSPTDGTTATGNILSETTRIVNAYLPQGPIWVGGNDVYHKETGSTDALYEGFVHSTAEDDAALAQIGAAQKGAREEASDVGQVKHRLGDDPTVGAYLPGEHYRLDELVRADTGAGEWDYDEDDYPVGAWRVSLPERAAEWEAYADLGASYEEARAREFAVPPSASHTHPPNPELCRPGGLGTAEVTSAYEFITWAAGAETWDNGGGQPFNNLNLNDSIFDAVPAGSDGWIRPGSSNISSGTLDVTAGVVYRVRMVWGRAGSPEVQWVVRFSGSGNEDHVVYSGNPPGQTWLTFTGDFTAPVGATMMEFRKSWGGVGVGAYIDEIEIVTVDSAAVSGGGSGDGHPDLVGTSPRAARCDHRHDVHRDRAPTADDDWPNAGYKLGTIWAYLDDLDNPTLIIATYMAVDVSDGAAVWLLLTSSTVQDHTHDGVDSGASDHGNLAGLEDDDHPQYEKASVLNVVMASGTTETLDRSLYDTHDITLTDDCTLTFTGATAGKPQGMAILLRQGASPPHLVTWPASVEWVGGSAPTLQTALNAWDWVALVTLDGGTTWYAQHAGTSSGSSSSTGELLISDTPSTPLVFADLIQNEAQDDLVYSD